MKIFKNPESVKILVISAAATVIVAAFSCFAGWQCAAFCVLTGAITSLLFSIATEYRYRRIEKMSNAIEKILHGSDESVINDFREGELSILQSEVSKMTKRLRESAAALEKDKNFLSDSIADISHQLRTPLTSVNLLISSLADKEQSYEQRLRTIYELKTLISKIQLLIDTLLKMSKIDAGAVLFDKKEVTVSELIKKASQPLYAPMDIRNQQFVIKTENESFEGDMLWSCEALTNILKNCMEHNPDGSNIYISAKKTNIFTEIIIEDEGCGFSEKDLAHIFERFYKGKGDNSDGFGIGLSLARAIIVNQNGTIKAQNRKEGGARFIIRFYLGTV